MRFRFKSDRIEGMDSPEQRYTEPMNSQEAKKPVDYGRVALRIKDIQEQERKHGKDPKPDEKVLLAFAQKHSLESSNSREIIKILSLEIQALADHGLTLNDLGEDEIEGIRREIAREETHEEKTTLESRLTELQQTDKPLASVLEVLKQEFGESMDEETQAVINNFRNLISPEIIPDKDEREAIEVLFATQSITTFNKASFTGFVETIYEEDTISEETKQRIEKKFGIPRSPIKSGKELAEWTLKKDEEGNYLHNSPDTALEFRKGVKTHVDKQGNTLLTIAGNARTKPLAISPERLRNGELLASLANYSLIRNVVFEEFDHMTNLFGGGDEDDLITPSENTIHDANQFAQKLIGKRSPDSILTKEDLAKLKQALTAMHNPAKTGEDAIEAQLQELGVLSNDNIQWGKVEEIGAILRENQNFRTFELAHTGDAHQLLKQELKARSEHETQPTQAIEEAMHGTGTSVHGFSIRWEWIFKMIMSDFMDTHRVPIRLFEVKFNFIAPLR